MRCPSASRGGKRRLPYNCTYNEREGGGSDGDPESDQSASLQGGLAPDKGNAMMSNRSLSKGLVRSDGGMNLTTERGW